MPRKKKTEMPPQDDVLTNAISLGMQGFTLKRITNITELLRDRETLLKIAEIVATGGSINTVEMAIGLPVGMLKTWLHNGKMDRDGTEFKAFYKFYLAAASEARRAAEASLLMRNPGAWLDRCDPIIELTTHATQTDTIEAVVTKNKDDAQASEPVFYKDFG